MSDHVFFAQMLRFVARRTERVDDRVAAMMEELEEAAGQIEARGLFVVQAGRSEIAARAFAGVAAFLQKQILPEAIAHENEVGERQVRWAVDAAMEAVTLLLRQAAAGEAAGPTEVVLPAPPAA